MLEVDTCKVLQWNRKRSSDLSFPFAAVLEKILILSILALTGMIRHTRVYKEMRENFKLRPWCSEETCAISSDKISESVSTIVFRSRTEYGTMCADRFLLRN